MIDDEYGDDHDSMRIIYIYADIDVFFFEISVGMMKNMPNGFHAA